MLDERLLSALKIAVPEVPEPVEFPLRVASDWDERVQRANRMAKLIDRHLEYEAYSRSLPEAEQLTPKGLCPEQRVSLLTDMQAITRELQTFR
jgi:hypothetical protein